MVIQPAVFPLAFFGRHDDDRHAVVFPLFWHFSSPQKQTTLALPLFGHWRNHDERTTSIFPLLYFQGENKTNAYAVQFPLLWHFRDKLTDTSTTVVGPGFYRTKPRGWSAELFPFFFAGNSDDHSHAVVAPIFWHFANQQQDISTTLIGPYLHARNGGETTNNVAAFAVLPSRPKKGGTYETSFTLFPLVHYKRTATERLFVSPLAMSKRTNKLQAGFIGPYFWYNSPTTAVKGILPAWFDVTNKPLQERSRLLGPWVAIDRPGATARYLLPFWGHYQSQTPTGHEQGTYLFPTFFHQRNQSANRQGLRFGHALSLVLEIKRNFWRHFAAGTLVFAQNTAKLYPSAFPAYAYTRNNTRSLLITPLGYHHHSFSAHTHLNVVGLAVLPQHNGHQPPDGALSFLVRGTK